MHAHVRPCQLGVVTCYSRPSASFFATSRSWAERGEASPERKRQDVLRPAPPPPATNGWYVSGERRLGITKSGVLDKGSFERAHS